MARTIIKEHSTFKRYDDGTILLKGITASYPHVGEINEFEDPETKKVSKRWSTKGLLPKVSHRAAKEELLAMINELIEENKSTFKKGEKVMLPPNRKFLADGDKGNKIEESGMFVIAAGDGKNKPSVRDRRARPMRDDDVIDALFYGGCKIDLLIRPWFQNHAKYGKRVNANLVAIQFIGDGKPLGEGRVSEDDLDETFDAVDDDDENAAFDPDLDDDDDL